MSEKSLKEASLCVHTGSIVDTIAGGVTTPIFTSSSYKYRDLGNMVYPRYFNTPNQISIVQKIAALEKAETGLVFSSGMAAIYSALMGILEAGDHIIFQQNLYGGTHHLVTTELEKIGVSYTLVDSRNLENFEKAVQPRTKAIYIETPANPLLDIVDIKGVADIAKAHGLITLIDNTFASPINQKPITLGIDIVLHSGTKYLGGHSDISFGAALCSTELTQRIHKKSTVYGANLNALTCYLIERSMKTLSVRVQQQNKNALALAQFLETHPMIEKVNYPGLSSHEGHEIAKRQMSGFGGMLSFELKIDTLAEVDYFQDHLKMIQVAGSLGSVETLLCSPRLSSHAKITPEKREAMGIRDGLLRLSVGIEDIEDLKEDIYTAIEKMRHTPVFA